MKTNLVAESEQSLVGVGYLKMSCFVNGSQINYLPQPSSVENFSQLTNHARSQFCSLIFLFTVFFRCNLRLKKLPASLM